VVAATHDPAVAEQASRVIRMADGRIIHDPAVDDVSTEE
jgi:ABC-type lipoprotein export system ATPase subunit